LAALVVAVAGCGGNASTTPTTVSGSGSGSASASASASASGSAARGDAQIRIEWKDPPASRRASPGRNGCGLARQADVEPTSTWGIPDVAVWLDAGTGSAVPVRVVLAPCSVTPRIALAHSGGALTIASEIDQPVLATVLRFGDPASPQALAGFLQVRSLPVGVRTGVELPIIGHSANIALPSPTVMSVVSPDDTAGQAWVVTVPTAGGITDAQGQVVIRDLPTGTHAVTAWLPPRGKDGAQVVRGSVDVLPGGLAEVTLDLGSGGGM
jgi:hypothetical protein